MCSKTRDKKAHTRKRKKVSRYRRGISNSRRILYTFLILFGALVLAGIALFLRIEAPVVWAFLSSVGSWVALTSILGRN